MKALLIASLAVMPTATPEIKSVCAAEGGCVYISRQMVEQINKNFVSLQAQLQAEKSKKCM